MVMRSLTNAVEALLGHETGAEKDDGFRINVPEPDKSFFAIHERHREIEQDQIEVMRTLPENIETFETGLRGHDFEPCFGQNPFSQDKSHRFVIHDEDAAFFPGNGRRRIFRRRKWGQVRMERKFFASPARVLDELRGHLRRAIDTGSKHLKIFLRSFAAFPNILDDRAGPGNDFEKIVQLARSRRGGCAGVGVVGWVGRHAAKSGAAVNTSLSAK